MEIIQNKVAESGLINLSLKELLYQADVQVLDIAGWLYEGIILREDDFKSHIRSYLWSRHSGRTVVLTCSSDAIVPMWAWMLISSKLEEHQARSIYSDPQDLEKTKLLAAIADLPLEPYRGQRVLINGCQHPAITPAAFAAITQRLQTVVRSLMYGEACSNVPIFKRK
ncbi:MAG: DUF2480 family protein [Thermaurantimonas sp.]|uniref:DUF2480 family protein n=1 Tax=Thermaurantimonas sp. TaxID=2681568 RepID=UPI00391D2FD6